MGSPNTSELPPEVYLERYPDRGLAVSPGMIDLMGEARAEYEWPRGVGADRSQLTILHLERRVSHLLETGSPESAQKAVLEICDWGGNNARALPSIEKCSETDKEQMLRAIWQMRKGTNTGAAMDMLAELPGMRLVMATKVYRFYCPSQGAALDRHSSYFFNSLDIRGADGKVRKSTEFKREWATGNHTTSRLAIYQPSRHAANRDEYIRTYLPLLRMIADRLNRVGIGYICAAKGTEEKWRPADVEMAAYYWWALHGDR